MMKTKTDDEIVHIEGAGVEFLRMKADFATRLGEAMISSKGSVSFPVAFFPTIEDLFDKYRLEKAEAIQALAPFSEHMEARGKSLEIIEGDFRPSLPKNWNDILDPAQITAVAAMVVPRLRGLCLFDEQGTGKTVMSIAAFDILRDADEIDAMIVICPKSMVSEWPKDLNRFLGNEVQIVIAEGSRLQKRDAALKEFDVLVTNYEGVDPMLVALSGTATKRRYLLVVDESFYVKNSDTLRAETATLLRARCKRCFVLCGTPAPNSAHDLINQFNLADQGFTFGGFKKSKDPDDDWLKITTLVDARGLFIRRLKSEVLDHVPEKNFHVIRVELTSKQALMYETARNELEIELRNLNNETFRKKLFTYFQRRSALLQICACPTAIDPMFSDVPVKYVELDKILDNLITAGRKVVIWSFYKKSLDEICQRYAKFNPVRVDGSVSTIDRKEAVRAFQEDTETMLFVGNPSAAGAGITLHSSYDAVYVSFSNQAAHYLQSLDRIHRRGQISDEVNYYLLICKNTVEETELIRLRGKEINQHTLLSDHIPWPSSLDEALTELQGHG